MATFRAIAAVSNAIVRLLGSQYQPADFDTNPLEFKVYLASDFAKSPMTAGVSVFLYRVYVNNSFRTPNGRPLPDGTRQRTQLPIDLHLLLTAWGKDATLQHTITGWMMRVLEDTPSFPPGLLNQWTAGVFRPDETVEIATTDLSTEELFRIWEVIGVNAYQISVPYIARVVKIESSLPQGDGEPVERRVFRMGELIAHG
jgi:hypothetical protein